MVPAPNRPAAGPRTVTVRRLLAYDRAVFTRFENASKRRGWKAATQNHETGHLSVKNTLAHILNVHEAWIVAVAQDRWEIFDEEGRQPKAIRSWADLAAYRNRVWAAEDSFLAQLTDRGLARRVRAPWMKGRYTLEDAFFQVSFEQAHHLGEIIAVLWQHDRAPPPMTWIENLPSAG